MMESDGMEKLEANPQGFCFYDFCFKGVLKESSMSHRI
jgi:hypothetical protein